MPLAHDARHSINKDCFVYASLSPSFAPVANYHFFKRFGMVIAAVAFYLLGGMVIALQVLQPGQPVQISNQALIGSAGYAGLGLLLLFWLQNRKEGVWRTFKGHTLRRPLLLGVLASVLAYALTLAYMKAFDVPEEPFMATFFDGLDQRQIVLLCLSLILLPPLAEELMFRHFLLRLVPWERGLVWQWVAILLSTLAFTLGHTQYQNYCTLVLLMAGGIILAMVRIASGGLLAPMLVHASMEVIALATDQLYKLLP